MGGMIVAFDIDGTVMHSKRCRQDGDICIERINGEEHGFMSARVVDGLQQVSKMTSLIPVTTRSIAQYERIKWPYGTQPHLAYVANGAIMLRSVLNGGFRKKYIIDVKSHEYADCLTQAMAFFKRDPRFISPRIVDDCYAMARIDTAHTNDFLGGVYYSGSMFDEHRERTKYYLFPKECNKGRAIESIRAHFPDSAVVCAGDTANDFCMGQYSDEAIFPESTINTKPIDGSFEWENIQFEEYVITKLLKFVASNVSKKESE